MSKFLVAVLAAASLVVGGASPATHASFTGAENAQTALVQQNSENPRDLFRAVLFLQGPVVNELYDGTVVGDSASFNAVSEAMNLPDTLKNSDKIIDEIQAKDPGVFVRFARDLSSGRPLIVERAIEQGREAVASTPTANQLLRETKETYVPGEVGTDCGTVVVVGAFFVLAAGVFAVAGAVIWLGAVAGQAAAVAEAATAVRVVNVKSSQNNPVRAKWIAELTARLAK
ncbi:hypothetical protein [Mycetocola sp. JXN-3]|uniref:hypothetical protein n=1 Tax=Mycetocola sp. JXN-3 TaxID=2116510 RepID=UPI00165D018C|nr:hypothetical protein [Mycetocola sp. JXN-3]